MRIKYFLVILTFIIIFLGCGGGSDSGSGPVLLTSQISGKISFDELLASEREIIANNSKLLRASRFGKIIVFLEEMPSRALFADNEGNYCFTDLPLDCTYHVIAIIESLSGKTYKARSNSIFLSKTEPAKVEDFLIAPKDEAKNQIRLQVKDNNDKPVGRCTIWLWGEEFKMDESGCYISPLMPVGAVGKIKVIPPPNKDLTTIECEIDSSAFDSNIKGVSSVTLLPAGIYNKKAPFVSLRVEDILPGGAAIRICGSAIDPQGDSLDLEWSTSVGAFTYTHFDGSYVEWGVPSEDAEVIITLKATQRSSKYPLLYSCANLPIRISKSGDVSFPGQIVIVPAIRNLEIVSSASSQITGDTIAKYEAKASFPSDLDLFYTWNTSLGSFKSGKNNKVVYWNSPVLSESDSKTAVLTCSVSDGIATVTEELQVKVTSFPTVEITSPKDSTFYPSVITFKGKAEDYKHKEIDSDKFAWYVATATNDLKLIQSGDLSFSYNFTKKDSYTIALEAVDDFGIIGTATKEISIMNLPPEITILSPQKDYGYLKGDKVVFNAKVTDYEDGLIDDPERIKWFSDIDKYIGSGTYFELSSLSKGMHSISVMATDNDGAVSSASVLIWYDMPARIVLSPSKGSVFWGNEITFAAKGVNVDNKPLDHTKYKWYLDDNPVPWKEGIESFTCSDLPAGTHFFKVVGTTGIEKVESDVYSIEVAWEKPKIIDPISKTRFEPGTTQTFTANVGATGTLQLDWYVDNSKISAGSGKTFVTSLDLGIHSVSYSGKDALGNEASSTVEVVVEKLPNISINIEDKSVFFINHNIDFETVCLDSNNANINPKMINWYLDDNKPPVLLASGKTYTALQGNAVGYLPPGNHKITVAATGPFGTTASKTIEITSGLSAVSIDKPVNLDGFCLNGYSTDEVIHFDASPKNPAIPLTWYCDNAFFKNTNEFDHSFPATGTYSISVTGTDSANVANSAQIQLTVGKFPIMDFFVKNLSGKNVDPEDGVFFTDSDIEFVGVGTDVITGAPVSSSNMSWWVYKDSGRELLEENYSGITVNRVHLNKLNEGNRKFELVGKSSGASAVTGQKTKMLYLNFPNPKITKPVNGSIVLLDASDPGYSAIFDAEAASTKTDRIKFEWWCDWGTDKAVRLTDVHTNAAYGKKMSLRLPSGSHTLSCIGTDTADVVRLDTVRIIVSNNVEMEFTPKDKSSIFKDTPFTLRVIAGANDESKVEWTVKGPDDDKPNELTGNTSSFYFDEAELAGIFKKEGWHQITASSINEFGLNLEATNNIYYGLTAASISVSTSSLIYSVNSSPNFTATPTVDAASSVRAESTQWFLDGNPIAGYNNKNSVTIKNGVKGSHTLDYVATDGAGSVSVSTVDIVFDDGPTATFFCEGQTTPVNNAVFYELSNDRQLVFVGQATDTVNNSKIENHNLTWSLYKGENTNTTAICNVSNSYTFELDSGKFYSPGTYTIELEAEDQFGLKERVSASFYYGHASPKISKPDKDRLTIAEGEKCTLSGNKDKNAKLPSPFEWYSEKDGIVSKIGTGYEVKDVKFTRGLYTITYIATDSAGIAMSDAFSFTVNGSPKVKIVSPANDSGFFGGQNITFTGDAKKSDNSYLNSSNVTWYKSESLNAEGTKIGEGLSIEVDADKIATGSCYIRMIAVDDEFAEKLAASATIYITSGIALPKINSPVANLRFDNNANIDFAANDLSPIKMSWKSDDNKLNGSGNTVSCNNLTRGWRTVTYSAEDSNKKKYSDSVRILVNTPPTFVKEPAIITPESIWTGKATNDDTDYHIVIIPEGTPTPLNFTVSAKNSASSDIASITWIDKAKKTVVPGSVGNPKDFKYNAQPGSYTYSIIIEDEFNVQSSTTYSFWVWNCETYPGYASASYMCGYGNNILLLGTKADAEHHSIVKINRNGESGDLNDLVSSTVASWTSKYDLMGMDLYENDLYSLSGDGKGNIRYQKWNIPSADLSSDLTDDKELKKSGLTTVSDFAIGDNLYVCDKTNKIVKKISPSDDGTCVFLSNEPMDTTAGICKGDSDCLYVADTGGNKVIKIDYRCNLIGGSEGIVNPTNLTFSNSTKKLYVTSQNQNVIYVVDTSSNKLLYSFGKTGTTPHQGQFGEAFGIAICGNGNSSDLYVSDRKNNCIVRFRCGSSW